MSGQASTIKHSSLPLLCCPHRCIYHCYYAFREALPGLIGSSWSQNPFCCSNHPTWTSSYLFRQQQRLLAACRSVQSGHKIQPLSPEGDGEKWTSPQQAWIMAWEGHLGRNSHLALHLALLGTLLRATGHPSTQPARRSHYVQYAACAF